MCSTPAMSKQSDGCLTTITTCVCPSSACLSLRKLCVLGGIYYIYSGSSFYASWTDWV